MEFVRAGAGARMMYRRPTIYFDWDGTLADSMPLCIAHIRQTLEELGLPPKTNAEMAKCNGPTYQESVQVLGIPDDMAEAYLETRQRVELALINEWQRLFPGIREMLQSLAPLADLVIVSNGLPDYLHASMQKTGIAEYFTRVQPLIPGKTKTQALRMVVDEMQPIRCVMVGDRRGDVLAGRDNGLPTIAACYGYGLPDEWALADRQAYSVEQLQQQLMDWAERGM